MKNGSTFSDVKFHVSDPRNRVPYTFQPVLRKLLVKDKQPHLLIISSFSALFTTKWSKFLNGNCVVGQGGGGGGTPHMKGVRMFVVSLRGVNFGFWSHLRCSGQNAIMFSREGLV